MTAADRRFPRAVYEHGSDPDPRFSLANERTFLAWIRTSLAFIAAGLALSVVRLPMPHGSRVFSAGIFIVLGLLSALQSWIGWARVERALRLNQPLPSPKLALTISMVVVIAALLLAAALFL